MSRFEYVFFDLDGTLSKSAPGITKAVQYALDSAGIHEPDLKKLEAFIGPPLFMSFKQFCGFDDEMCAHMVDKYREYYDVKGVYETELYSGIERLLPAEKNAGQQLAVCSSKPYPMVMEVLRHLKIAPYFSKVTGAAPEKCSSPKGNDAEQKNRLLGNALQEWYQQIHGREQGLSFEAFKSRCVMVGDRKYDIQAGIDNGIATMGAAFGYGGRTELEKFGADFIVDDVHQMGHLLLA